MSSQIVCRGRVICRVAATRRQVSELPLRADGSVADGSPIPANSPQSSFIAGKAFFHTEDRIWYRVLKTLDPTAGWASSDFWQDRWHVDHKAVLSFSEAGFLDAATEEGSLAVRYRCRDEYGLKESKAWKLVKNRLLRAIKYQRKLERSKEGGTKNVE
jgi:hypothetical protein